MALPSVTRILQAVGLSPDFSFVKEETLKRARARGAALHLAIRYHHKGTLDESTLHAEIEPGFRAYLAFVKATEHVPIASELELVHPQWNYIGHPDRIGWCNGKRVIVDYKYTAGFDKEYVRLQLAGYRLLWDATHPRELIDQTLGLHLKRDGFFAIYDLTDNEGQQDFLAAVVIYRALERRGVISGLG